MVAGYLWLHHPRGQHRLLLFRHERVFSVHRAGVRLEPHGDFGSVFAGAYRIGPTGTHRRLFCRSRRAAAHHVHRHRHLRAGFCLAQLRRFAADALCLDRVGHRSRFQSRLSHADQFADRQNIPRAAQLCVRHFSHGAGTLRRDRAPGRRDDRLVGLAHGGCAFGLHAADRGAADRLCDQQDRPSGRTGQRVGSRRQRRRSVRAGPIAGSPVYVKGSFAPQRFLVSFGGDGVAPYGHRRRVGALRHSPRRSRVGARKRRAVCSACRR